MKMKPLLMAVVAVSVAFVMACNWLIPTRLTAVATVITVNDAQPGAEAFAIKDTKILAVGTLAGKFPRD
jgi:hypothetical protein